MAVWISIHLSAARKGAAFVYELSSGGWSNTAILRAQSSSDLYFGGSVACLQDEATSLLAIGSYGHEADGKKGVGSVYIFEKVIVPDILGWSLQATLTGSTVQYSYFGSAVTIGKIKGSYATFVSSPGGIKIILIFLF